jgi:hypothetical protein
MTSQVSCVVRKVRGQDEYISITDPDLIDGPRDGEAITSGQMESFQVKDGPSGSHVRTVWDPRGTSTRSIYRTPPVTTCVVRDVNGVGEYLRVEDIANLPIAARQGERTVSGVMQAFVIKAGPSKSHSVTCWTPRGTLTEGQYQTA